MRRNQIEAASRIMSRAYEVPEDPRKAADEAEGLIYAVSRGDETEASQAGFHGILHSSLLRG